MDQARDIKVYTKKQLEEIFDCKPSKRYKITKRPDFPAPRILGSEEVFLSNEVDEYLLNLPVAKKTAA